MATGGGAEQEGNLDTKQECSLLSDARKRRKRKKKKKQKEKKIRLKAPEWQLVTNSRKSSSVERLALRLRRASTRPRRCLQKAKGSSQPYVTCIVRPFPRSPFGNKSGMRFYFKRWTEVTECST